MFYRGRITSITARGVFVEIPDLAIGLEFGPVEVIRGAYQAGDSVTCAQVVGAKEDIIVLGIRDRFPTQTNLGGTIGVDPDGVAYYDSSRQAKGNIGMDPDGVIYYDPDGNAPGNYTLGVDEDGVIYYSGGPT